MNFVNITFENSFQSLEAALAACLLIGSCHKVLDFECDKKPDDKNTFHLCTRKPTGYTSFKSCVYEKNHKTMIALSIS